MTVEDATNLLLLTLSRDDFLDGTQAWSMRTFWLWMEQDPAFKQRKGALTQRLPALLTAPPRDRKEYTARVYALLNSLAIGLPEYAIKDLEQWERTGDQRDVFLESAIRVSPHLERAVPDVLLEFFDAFCEGRPIRSHW